MTAGVHRLRVRYAETDRMGIAHHANYVVWFEEARTEWLRARGHSYRELEDQGVLLRIVEVAVRYLRPTTYDDLIEIHTDVAARGPATLELEYRAFSQGHEVAVGRTKLACVDRDGRVRRLPPGLGE